MLIWAMAPELSSTTSSRISRLSIRSTYCLVFPLDNSSYSLYEDLFLSEEIQMVSSFSFIIFLGLFPSPPLPTIPSFFFKYSFELALKYL
jgi:hypothetical protein